MQNLKETNQGTISLDSLKKFIDKIQIFPLENLKIELLKFVNCILNRLNLTNQRLPAHLKIQSIELLDETKLFLNNYLTSNNTINDNFLFYLECYYSCGLLYLIQYRYSIMSSNDKETQSSVVHSQTSLDDLKAYLNDLNLIFKLNDKVKKQVSNKKTPNYKALFYLVN